MSNLEGKRKPRVAILTGGKSGEHEVSLQSAKSVIAALDRDKYDVVVVGVTKQGRWIAADDALALLESGAALDDAMLGSPSGAESSTAILPSDRRELVPGTSEHPFPRADVVFPVMHGTYGEDGTVQGLLELAGLPYVGAGVLGSALGLDKVTQKNVLEANGVPVVPYHVVLRSRWRAEREAVLTEVLAHLALPLFVKPSNGGSSVGCSKAHTVAELAAGLDLAARFDRKLLVETAVNAREIECSVLGNDEPIASVPGEVEPGNEFYDYHAKYLDDNSILHIPADLPAEVTQRVQALAIQAFLAIDCAGMARVDFFLDRDTGTLYLNELNTIPGFTRISMYPKLWEASGLPYPQLLDRLIELALERHRDRLDSETAYGYDH
ncbi:MAG: D-alanine--D-alanine ligase family protein [Anaerolineales bacterium]